MQRMCNTSGRDSEGSAGERSRGPGAPPGNHNRTRHGLRSRRILEGGKLPKKLDHVEKRAYRLRRELERQVVELRGEISVDDAKEINSALVWERAAALNLHWLRTEHDDLSTDQRRALASDAAKATDKRNAAIDKLHLTPIERRDPWAVFDAKRAGKITDV